MLIRCLFHYIANIQILELPQDVDFVSFVAAQAHTTANVGASFAVLGTVAAWISLLRQRGTLLDGMPQNSQAENKIFADLAITWLVKWTSRLKRRHKIPESKNKSVS